jgi:PAS domain S-box-containing protein
MRGFRRLRGLVQAVGALVTLAVAAGVALFLWVERSRAVEQAEAVVADLARIIAAHGSRTFETSELIADIVAAEVRARGGAAAVAGDARFDSLLRDLAGRSRGDRLLLVDRTGRPVAQGGGPGVPEGSLAGEDWFRAHAEAGAAQHVGALIGTSLGASLGTPAGARGDGELRFAQSRALTDAAGRFDGAVQVAMRPAFFEDAPLSAETARAVTLSLIHAEGRLLVHSGTTAAMLGTSFAGTALHRRTLEAPEGLLRDRSPIDGSLRIFAFRRLPDRPVLAVAALPEAAALGPYRRTLSWSLGALALVLGGVLGLTHMALRAVRQQETAQAALEISTRGLEDRVADRTHALAAANAELEAGAARFRGIFSSAFSMLALLDTEGRIVEANEALLGFAALDPAAAAGREAAALLPPEDSAGRDRLAAAVAEAARGGFVRYEADLARDGRRVAVDLSLKPVGDAEGRVVAVVLEGRDVSELKTAQARLHEAQKLETLGQLVGGVAHDFNNLLMAVLGNLDLLRKRLPDDPRARRMLEGAVQGAERGAALTQRMLAFARRQQLTPAAVALAPLVEGMTEMLRRTLGPRIRILAELPDGLPPVRADRNQLELALFNLALNARDAMAEAGTLRIAARAAEAPPGLPPGDYVALAVTDSGSGMDAETLRRATEPFFTTKGPGRGSGLGLSMVHGLAEQSGGRLTIESRPGAGTRVEIVLPRAAAEEAPPAPLPPPAPLGPLRILVVDDDRLIAGGTAAMLEDLGHEAVVVGSASEAIVELRRAGRVDLVLTDVAMPGMTGVQLARVVAEAWPGLPVVLASGFAEYAFADAGEWPRLAKPYRRDDLARAIAAAIRPRDG